ncbi:putative ABC transport system permease protein [Mucilaginibacter gossypiicola]|uniref:Putative ABC transport system permease protein n=1 Tax=Mucilaginibacter gossypiicola TaxID=551995 RepID=A0A1H7ZG71_9SPHI|nr:ABC transporter permease [Mucilaginibacter gossypiicola]SEM57263.1 putative ABC transport system permease protein [Mucilaginibacter gossypiicola]
MIKNYIKTAWRNLVINKVTSLISIAGLAVGIGCFILLATYLLNELRYDRFHANANRIVRVAYNYKSSDDAEAKSTSVTPTAPVPVFKQQLQEIEDGVRIYWYNNPVQYQDKLFNEKRFLLADEPFFKIFSFKFLKGNAATALKDPSAVVITASTAKKYFGNEDAIGKVLKVNNKQNMMVTGVVEDVPEYSQIKFDMVGSYAITEHSKTRRWDSANDYSYLLLKPGVNMASVEQKMNNYVAEMFKDDFRQGHKMWFKLEPLTDVHLKSEATYPLTPSGNIKYIYILGAVAVILLLLACVNFLNLVTAKAIERGHEIGVRKVMGAVRTQLFTQFIIESAMITLVSLLGGLFLADVSFKWFSDFSGQHLGFQTWNTSWLITALFGLFISVTFLAGTYPSLYLSAFNPIVTLKGKLTNTSGGRALRRSLVIFQFVVSVFFMICTVIAGSQLQYIQHLNIGINRSQVMVIDIGGKSLKDIKSFNNEVTQLPGVLNATASYDSPVDVHGGYSINQADGKNSDYNLSVTALPVERNFLNTLGIKLVQGINFTDADEKGSTQPDENKRHYGFIINEKAAQALGWKAEEAVGKHISLNGRTGEVRGIVQNFNFASLHQEITPIVMFTEDYFGKILIKTSGNNIAQTISAVKEKWSAFNPATPFEYHFLDQEFDDMYKAEQRTGSILTAFTLVTIFISCLGLFGLAVFSTRQRVKEVGVRKVLGASVFSIVKLVSGDFLKLVIISVIIASPIAWYAMHRWLQDFAYKISIQIWVFIAAGAVAILIAFITVSVQSLKAALANPVKSLRSSD